MPLIAWYLPLVLLVGVERLAELRVARRNAAWAAARGAREYGRGHYPVMVVLHLGLLAGCAAETATAHRAFAPALGWPMLVLLVAAQALRWWCVRSLGPCWNTRVLVVPDIVLSTRGPYRLLRHPNYVAVAAEGVALPLVGGAWITALCFTLLNAALLTVRIRCENGALATAAARAS